jgi:hypothetical protein
VIGAPGESAIRRHHANRTAQPDCIGRCTLARGASGIGSRLDPDRSAGEAEVIFDYVNPAASIAPAARVAHQTLADRVAALDERIQSYLDTAALFARMKEAGFRRVEDIGPSEIATRFFPETEWTAPARGGHLMQASTN